MRSFVNALPSVMIILVVVATSVAVVLVASLALRRWVPNFGQGPFEEMADSLRVTYELLYSLILAFVIGSVLGNFSAAEATVGSEATTLAHLKRTTGGLPVEKAMPLERGLDQYVHAIVEDEFPAMRDGEESLRTAASLETLYALYQDYEVSDEGSEAEFYGVAVADLGEVSSARRERLGLSKAELPTVLRVFLPLGGLVLLAIEFRSRMSKRFQLLHISLMAALVSFAYALTIVLDYPFSGDLSVSTEPYKQDALAEFWSASRPHELAAGETEVALTPEHVEGVWASGVFGVVVLRADGDQVRGVYRVGDGTIVGEIQRDGVLAAWWCESPTREAPDDAGEVEWRRVTSASDDIVYGSWRYGTREELRGGWDLQKVGGPEPPDLSARFDDSDSFCEHP